MKLQNRQIKLGEEIKNLLSMREGFNARFSALDSIYLQVKELYEKVVPPVGKLEAIGYQMERDFVTMKEVVRQFDISIC